MRAKRSFKVRLARKHCMVQQHIHPPHGATTKYSKLSLQGVDTWAEHCACAVLQIWYCPVPQRARRGQGRWCLSVSNCRPKRQGPFFFFLTLLRVRRWLRSFLGGSSLAVALLVLARMVGFRPGPKYLPCCTSAIAVPSPAPVAVHAQVPSGGRRPLKRRVPRRLHLVRLLHPRSLACFFFTGQGETPACDQCHAKGPPKTSKT